MTLKSYSLISYFIPKRKNTFIITGSNPFLGLIILSIELSVQKYVFLQFDYPIGNWSARNFLEIRLAV